MNPVTCPACGYEYEVSSTGPTGACCPRCAEPAPPVAGAEPQAAALETYLGAALGGAALGLLAAAGSNAGTPAATSSSRVACLPGALALPWSRSDLSRTRSSS